MLFFPFQCWGEGGNGKTLTLSPKSKKRYFTILVGWRDWGGGVGGGWRGLNVKTLTLSPESKNAIYPFRCGWDRRGGKCHNSNLVS